MGTGIVFNIQRFTVHDGPGIRTEFFMKGCTLRCKWCSNPESFLPTPQVGVYATKCIGKEQCGDCLSVCPHGEKALLFGDGKLLAIDRRVCDECMRCVDPCPSDALKAWGKSMTVDEAMEVIRQDLPFYARSGGGVTFSGGEALFQWEFVRDVLRQCKAEGIHTCVESALCVPRHVVEAVMPYCDMMITDIKHMDSAMHKKCTGQGNELILSNIKFLVDNDMPLVLRLPTIPGVNDNEDHVRQVGDFIIHQLGNKLRQVQFLRFRRLGEEKYQSIGLPYRMSEVDPPRQEFEAQIKQLVQELNTMGIPAYAGTTHKINL